MQRCGPPGQVVKQDLHGDLVSGVSRLAVIVERLVDEWQDHCAAQRRRLDLDGNLDKVLNRADAAADPGAVADRGQRLVPEGEGDEYAVDGVLQLTGNTVVVLRRDEQICVCLGDLPVPSAHDLVRVRRVARVADAACVLAEHRQGPVPEIDHLSLKCLMHRGPAGDPRRHLVRRPGGPGAADNDL